jgi:Ca2+ transporting ATPase
VNEAVVSGWLFFRYLVIGGMHLLPLCSIYLLLALLLKNIVTLASIFFSYNSFVYAAYVGLATIAGFAWWFVYSENGPRLPYSELVSWGSEILSSFCSVTFWSLLESLKAL